MEDTGEDYQPIYDDSTRDTNSETNETYQCAVCDLYVDIHESIDLTSTHEENESIDQNYESIDLTYETDEENESVNPIYKPTHEEIVKCEFIPGDLNSNSSYETDE